jgi:hypothetical protein
MSANAYRRPWINREEKAAVLDLLVKIHPRYGWLYDNIHAAIAGLERTE